MKAEGRLKTPSKYKIENSPKTIAWYAVSQGLEHEVDAIAEMIEAYHQSQLQALKKKGEKFFDECWHMNKNEFLNLITNLEDK